jgi:hypothetical protein
MESRISLLVLKLATLFGFCGGPLYLADLLKPRLGTQGGFALVFTPIGLVVFGALTFADAPSGFTRFAVRAGMLGGVCVLLMNVISVGLIVGGTSSSNPGLFWFGIPVGTMAVAWYLVQARSFVAQPRR